METGCARPSQKMVLRLARHLDVPLRERNSLLMATGYAYEVPAHEAPAPAQERGPREAVVPMRFRTPYGELAMFSSIATFGAPADVTLSELAIELFFPMDRHTEGVLRGWVDEVGMSGAGVFGAGAMDGEGVGDVAEGGW
ncbi:hypothetical protein [Streptomyces chrestomyceticus]|uniref:hypothetical protein n=1 Tax=Streptomyces chrestomyceticus TaxID=68185 RepID=UPI0027DCDE0C|nr:hypothetical protein [Streptomyces chrestomyceticus]